MRKLAFLLFTLVATLWSTATAENTHFSAADFDEIPYTEAREYTLQLGHVTITVSNGCISYGEFRIYKGQTMTITSTHNIKSVVVCSAANYTDKWGAGNFTVEVGSYDQNDDANNPNWGVWTAGSANVNEVVFTATNNQVRANDIEVETEDDVIRCSLYLGYYKNDELTKAYTLSLTETEDNVFTGQLVPNDLVTVVMPLLFDFTNPVSLDDLCVELTATVSNMPGSVSNQKWNGVGDAPAITAGVNPMQEDGNPWSLTQLITMFTGNTDAINDPVPITADFNRKVLILGAETIKGDINGDGSVDGNDVSIMLEMVLAGGVSDAQKAVADINGDTSVDGNDVSILLEMVLAGSGN